MNDDILDLKEFLERVQDDKDLMVELFDIYLEDFVEKRKLLGEAIQKNNFEEVRNVAHAIKGASGNISAKLLRESFMKLEDMGKNNNLDGAVAILSEVDKQFADLSNRIATVKKELKG